MYIFLFFTFAFSRLKLLISDFIYYLLFFLKQVSFRDLIMGIKGEIIK